MRLAKRSRVRRVMLALRLRSMIRTRNTIHKTALVRDQEDTPWYSMYASRNETSFIATVSLPPADFDDLLVFFDREYTVKSRYGHSGRPPRIQFKHAILAMVLHFYTAAVEHKTLQKLFGVAPSTFCRVLKNAEIALARALMKMRDADVRWPSKETQMLWASKTNAREPLVDGVFGFVDGKNFRVQTPSKRDLQNAQYNGWLHCVLVTGVLCFGLDGTPIWGRHNCPGSWNDGEVSRRLQELLSDPTKVGTGMKLAADSAFPVSGRCAGRIVSPIKEGDLNRQPDNCRYAMQVMSDCITSLRQAAEWGMGAVSKVYRQLLLPLLYDPELRGLRLNNMFRLYNLRVRRTGISQIKNVFEV
ncbi:hypothetical protein AC1031_016262 [Aphanomyces cochlioides]|nr:hypothetical protein AC1031_016262 [Aphanomyces cochlioides]